MLPLPHDPCGRRSHHQQIRQACSEHCHEWSQHPEPIPRFSHTREPGRTEKSSSRISRSLAGIGQGQYHRQSGLQGEVDGEDGLLQRGELGSWQSPVGHNAPYEGLKDLGSQEGSVA